MLSKEIATKISLLQNPTERNKTVRHSIITGETGPFGGYRKNSRVKLSKKWLEKFGGYENETEGTDYGMPDFKVSSKCCYYLKEKPCADWAKEHNSAPYLGLMASESGRREKSLMMHGCNYFGKRTIRSAPFAIFSRQGYFAAGTGIGCACAGGLRYDRAGRGRHPLHHQGAANGLFHVRLWDSSGEETASL